MHGDPMTDPTRLREAISRLAVGDPEWPLDRVLALATPDPAPTAEAAWKELVMDALASDGRISDADVKNAVRRHRPIIEAAIRAQVHPNEENS